MSRAADAGRPGSSAKVQPPTRGERGVGDGQRAIALTAAAGIVGIAAEQLPCEATGAGGGECRVGANISPASGRQNRAGLDHRHGRYSPPRCV